MYREEFDKIVGYCIWCKCEIKVGESYVVNELGEILHKFCDKQIHEVDEPFEPELENVNGE